MEEIGLKVQHLKPNETRTLEVDTQPPDEWKINEYIHNIGQAFN